MNLSIRNENSANKSILGAIEYYLVDSLEKECNKSKINYFLNSSFVGKTNEVSLNFLRGRNPDFIRNKFLSSFNCFYLIDNGDEKEENVLKNSIQSVAKKLQVKSLTFVPPQNSILFYKSKSLFFSITLFRGKKESPALISIDLFSLNNLISRLILHEIKLDYLITPADIESDLLKQIILDKEFNEELRERIIQKLSEIDNMQ